MKKVSMKSSHPLTGKLVRAKVRADKMVGRKRDLHVRGRLDYADDTITSIGGKWWWTSNVEIEG
jgi:hypothetical protein